VLRTGHITDMTGEAITAVQLADKLIGRQRRDQVGERDQPFTQADKIEPYCRAARLDQP